MRVKSKKNKTFPTIRLGVEDIIYEDENYLIINKKAGWICHKTVDKNRSNLSDAANAFIKNRDKTNQQVNLYLIHRLDVWTSGVIIFNKDKDLNKELQELFNSRNIKKSYEAIVYGKLDSEKTLENFLKENKSLKKSKMEVVKSGGKKAITEVIPINTDNGFSLVKLNILTGRKHQIRAQLQHAGFPIVGDKLYLNEAEASSKNNNLEQSFRGQLLHAKEVEFLCPKTKRIIKAHAPSRFDLTSISASSIRSGLDRDNHKYRYILFNKPFNTLCQFTKTTQDESSLKDYNLPKEIYPVGRLDKDSEGLLLLTNDGHLKNKLSSNESDIEKTYIVQVEGNVKEKDLSQLERGILIKGKKTLPAKVKIIQEMKLWQRIPPIRQRKNIPTTLLEIKIKEGRNRQVRRMTAAIGYPTLRLIRTEIGNFTLPPDLMPGDFKEIKYKENNK